MPEEGNGREERRMTASAPHPPYAPSDQGEDGQPAIGMADSRSRMMMWVANAGVLGAAIVAVANLAFFFQTGAWQLLVVAMSGVVGVAAMVPARRLIRRGELDAAGYWLLIGMTFIFATSELVQAGVTLYLAAGGVLMIFIVGSIVLPRKWGAWFLIAAPFGVFVWLVNQFEPLPRYDITTSISLRTFVPGIVALLVLMALWRAARAFHIGTIRTRLIVAFAAMAFLLATIIGVASTVVGFRSGQGQVVAQLESVATLKEAEIATWVDSMQSELSTVLAGAEAVQRASVLLQRESPDTAEYRDAYGNLAERFRQSVQLTGSFGEVFLMDRQGYVVLSTEPSQEGKVLNNETYFQRGLDGPYVRPPFHSPLEGASVVVVQPVSSQQGEVMGVLAGRASLDALDEIMLERSGLGETGETYLVSVNQVMLTASRFAELGEKIYVRTEGAKAAIDGHTNGSGLYAGYRGVPVVGVFHWLPELQMVLLAEQDQTEAFGSMYSMIAVNVGVSLLSVLLAAAVSLLVTRSIATPLASLTETAAQIAAGDLGRAAEVERRDEIGALARSFNVMTARLRDVIGGLEQRVIDRTSELEQRSAYQEASAEVSRAAFSILDADQLIRQVVGLIRERFKLYYVGLFLVDESGEWAVLRAGTGEAGRAMLARGHRLRVGQGMIGWSVANAQARVALEAETDAVRRVTAELPDTRSEAALPLRSRGQVIGALTVQSDQPGVFDSATIAVLQTMADQVAVALDNARLFTASQSALEVARRAYGESSREAWRGLLSAQSEIAYRSDARGITRAGDVWRPEMERAWREGEIVRGAGADREGEISLALPIKVRGSVIGVLDTYKPGALGEWTAEEIALLQSLVDQLGAALESARLYEDAQRRAARERLASEITDRMRRATDVEGIVQAAVDELFAVLGTSRAFVRLQTVSPASDAKRQGHDGTE